MVLHSQAILFVERAHFGDKYKNLLTMFAEIVRTIAQGRDKKYKIFAGLSFISFDKEMG